MTSSDLRASRLFACALMLAAGVLAPPAEAQDQPNILPDVVK